MKNLRKKIISNFETTWRYNELILNTTIKIEPRFSCLNNKNVDNEVTRQLCLSLQSIESYSISDNGNQIYAKGKHIP